MRKTSQDGGESTSATSRVENESKKSKGTLLDFKTKKRTAPNLSEESDEAVVEPLLEKKTDQNNQSAKYYAKAKADTVKEISKLFNHKKAPSESTSGFGTTETLLSEKSHDTPKLHQSNNAPLHNYMNTNVFHRHDITQSNGTTKSQIMVEVSNESGYNTSPLIFTTAKIHTDEKSKHMEPVQMTPAPIVSTVIDKSQYKYGKVISTTTEKKVGDATSAHCDDFYRIVEPKVYIKESNSKEINSSVIEQKTGENIQIKHLADKTAKSDIMTTLTNSASGFNTSSTSTFKPTTTVIAKDNASLADNNKMLGDEPRILLSDSIIKSTNLVTSVKSFKEPTEVLDSIIKQPQPSQLVGNNNTNNETTNARIETKTKQNDMIKEESKPSLNTNIKSPTLTKEFESKSNSGPTMPTQQQKYTTPGISNKTNVMIPKNTDYSKQSSANIKTSSAKNSETLKDSNTKTPISSKTTVQASNSSKEIDKTLKSSANGSVKMNSKVSSAATVPTTGKPASSIGLPSPEIVNSDVSNKAPCISSVGTVKAIASTVAPTTSITNATKTATQSTSTKIITSTPTPKPSSTKSTSKSSSTPTAGSVKPPTHTAKSTSSKPPSLATTKMPKVDISSPSAIATTGKSIMSKTIPVSANKQESTSSIGSRTSTTTVQASNNAKTKMPETNKHATKPMDRSKDPR